MSENARSGMSSKYVKWIVAALCVCVIAAVVIVMGMKLAGNEPSNPTNPGPSESIGSSSTPTTESVDPSDPTQPSQPTQPTQPSEPNQPTTPSDPQPSVPSVTDPTVPPATQPTGPSVTEPEVDDTITLPYLIPGTNLVIHNIAPYDGAYLEDASDVAVTGVAALVVENAGDTGVEYASITLRQGGTVLKFNVSTLPARSKAAVQEASRKPYVAGGYTACSAEVIPVDAFDLCGEYIQITENADNSLTITNISGEQISELHIYYKYYMTDEDAYLGGITYHIELNNLRAGQSSKVTLSHYASGYSKVVMVRISEEQ